MTPRRRIIPVFIPHLGCPNNCVFCNQREISGEIEPATAETVRATVSAALASGAEGAETAFYGGSFTAIPAGEQEALLSAAAEFMRAGRVSSLRLSTRPDCIDAAVLERLGRFGVETVELGAQSMDREVLRLAGRGHSPEDTERAAGLIKAAGFKLILQMMTGLPGDTAEKSLRTAEALAQLRPDGVRVYPTVILKNTPLFSLWQSGEYKEHTVDEAVRWGAEIYRAFERAGIPVIRYGLNPSDELSGGEAAGGAYHPALGELVLSRVYLEEARRLLSRREHGTDVTLLVGRGRTSVMTGQHRGNIKALCLEFGLRSVKVAEAPDVSEKVTLI